ncbi:hypothetical protein Osc7112_2455 [Oscillatoria nigro-viridis PCC 7112]|uniref:Uncharacterized protein n=1 Tax=Phormidium nigroviride PCC 7112 TaxID=179408 RepID=K9VH83_9CYAN|nr:hypothetical protein Osc7112_2455 [Oscillatoria nigro-viridis PCC 7112]
MAKSFTQTLNHQPKQTDSLPAVNILKPSFLENFANLNYPIIERIKKVTQRYYRVIAS